MAAAFAGPMTAAWSQSPKNEKTPLIAADREADATVRDKAKKAGLDAFNTRFTEHFLGVGNGGPIIACRCSTSARRSAGIS